MLRAGRGCRAQGEGTAGQPNLPCLWVITFILTPVRLNWLSADLILLYRLGLKKRCGDPRFWLPWTPSLPRPPARLDCASAVCLPASDPRRWPLDVHADSIFQEENEALVSPASPHQPPHPASQFPPATLNSEAHRAVIACHAACCGDGRGLCGAGHPGPPMLFEAHSWDTCGLGSEKTLV